MSSDRLARALLRLYPRAWRQRYGDEFLALIADGGLSWREVVDVIGAAGVERVRALAALVRTELDPETPPAGFIQVPFRETVRAGTLFMGLMSLSVGVLMLAGLERPPWMWWFWIFTNWNTPGVTNKPHLAWRERGLLSFLWYLFAFVLAGVAWLLAAGGRWLGIPEPADFVFWWSLLLFFGGVCARGIYCGVRSNLYGSTWKGLRSGEVGMWRLGLFATVVIFASVDPKGELFWMLSMILTFGFRAPRGWSRSAAAKRRAIFEESERFWSK